MTNLNEFVNLHKMDIPHSAVLKDASSLFHNTDRGVVLKCRLFDLDVSLRLAGFRAGGDVGDIMQDIWNMSNLLLRLRWTREQAKQGLLDTEIWRMFSQLDIENFLVQIRSAMDSAAHLLCVSLPKGKQLPSSFDKLRNAITKHQKKLTPDLAHLISQAQWFENERGAKEQDFKLSAR